MLLIREARQLGTSLLPVKGAQAFCVSWAEFLSMLPDDPGKKTVLSKLRNGSFVATYGKNSILVTRTSKLPTPLLKQFPALRNLGKIWEILELPIMNTVREYDPKR